MFASQPFLYTPKREPMNKHTHWIAILGFATALNAQAQGTPAALTDPSLPTAQRVDALIHAMTLDEKAGQMMNKAPAIPRLGIPAYDWWSEGLHGIARSGYATVFPQAIGMAATWDEPLVNQEANVIATEARAKYNRASAEGNRTRYFGLTIWSPNINIFRDPRWGRGQETYGEDPTLTGTLGSAFVRGLQGAGPGSTAEYYKTIATPKHFAVHSGPESTRHKANIDSSPYDLESTYTPAFRATIVGAKADSIMCSYNAVDGSPACASRMLLQQTLRDSWGFRGYVTSDCDAVHDFYDGHNTSPDAEHAAATAVLAGTDTDCGDTYKALPKAVHDGLLPESALDTALRRLFTARVELGMFDPPNKVPFNSIPISEDDSAAHRSLALKASEEAMVLLKNDGTLPLKPGVKTIAVIGPNAASLLALEGNYNAIPSHPVLPVDGITAQFPGAKVVYAQGSPYVDGVELPAPRTLFHTPGGKPGLQAAYYPTPDLTGLPAATRIDPQIDFDWTYASPVSGLREQSYSVRWTGTITPPKPGQYQFGLKISRCNDGCDNQGTDAERNTERVSVTFDGKPVDVSKHTPGTDDWGSLMPELDLDFPDTKPRFITIEYRHLGAKTTGGISLRWLAPADLELQQATAAASQADAVIAVVGLTSELEGEEMPVHIPGFSGGDRTSIDLPAPQEKLLEALGATGKPLVVVLENGSALAVNWAAQHANAILEAWYPGESGGTAIAETLAGKNNPGGKLPVTFYTGVNELPAFDNYSMRNRTYRYFTGKPLYPFGYGLSYTKFTYSNLKLSSENIQAGEPVTVEADVRNAGATAGDAVAELYLAPPQAEPAPLQQLVAFTRTHLAPNATQHLRWTLTPRQLSTVNAGGQRAMRAGEYTLSLGDAQPTPGTGQTGSLTITGEQTLPK